MRLPSKETNTPGPKSKRTNSNVTSMRPSVITSRRGSVSHRSLKNADTIFPFQKTANNNANDVLFSSPRTEYSKSNKEYEFSDRDIYQLLKNNTKKLRIFDEYFKEANLSIKKPINGHQRRNKSDGLEKIIKDLKASLKAPCK